MLCVKEVVKMRPGWAANCKNILSDMASQALLTELSWHTHQ